MGEFGAFYVAAPIFGPPMFYAKARAFALDSSGNFTAQDRVRVGGEAGAIFAIHGDSALFLSDDAQDRGAAPVAVPLAALTPVATLAADQAVTVGGQSFGVQIALGTQQCLPGDLLFTEEEAFTVLGFRNGGAFAVRPTGEVRGIGGSARLLQRRVNVGPGTAWLCDGDDAVLVSLRFDHFAGTGVRPGDEVALDGTHATVAGIADGYLWVVPRGGGIHCIPLQEWRAGTQRRVVNRPAADLSQLYAALRLP
jgi:hypothetical protein